jgi:hypothetical protein
MAAWRIYEPIEPMTLGNMRANGVQSLESHAGSASTGDHERGPLAR